MPLYKRAVTIEGVNAVPDGTMGLADKSVIWVAMVFTSMSGSLVLVAPKMAS